MENNTLGSKGLTGYEKTNNAVLKRDCVLVAILMFWIFTVLGAYTWGRIDGWNRGEFFTEKNIERAFVEAVETQRDFYIRNINVKFYPRKDGGVNARLTQREEGQ